MLKIVITTKSPLMLGSGGGRGSFIDADIIFDEYGLPVFPARRLKGLLRESAIEIQEMFGQAGIKGFINLTIDQLFGSSILPTSFRISSLHPVDYKETIKSIKEVQDKFRQFINKESVMDALTELRQQTAINEDGYAKENSLRTIRLLASGFCFEGEIEILRSEWEKEIETILALACMNLKRAGTGRNRGWGEISCKLYNEDMNDLGENVVRELKLGKQTDKTQNSFKENKHLSDKSITDITVRNIKGNTHRVKFRITNKAPLLFPSPHSDENMVRTLDYIPGSVLHGFFANKFIRTYNLNPERAHEKQVFKKWFLEGALCFSNGYLSYHPSEYHYYQLYPGPLFFYTDKDNETPYNILIEKVEADKAIDQYCTFTNRGEMLARKPIKVVNFHLQRSSGKENSSRSRVEGHGDDGGIFHYEALKEGQDFHGYILGSRENLQAFLDIFSTVDTENGDLTTDLYLGRSLNTQYGKAVMRFADIEEFSPSVEDKLGHEAQNVHKLKENQVLLYLLSPLVLYNSMGYPAVSTNELVDYLRDVLDNADINIEQSFARVESRDAFASHWKLRQPLFRCFSAGSCFLLDLGQNIDKNWEEKLTEHMRKGLGEMRSMGYGQVMFWHEVPYPHRLLFEEIQKPDYKESNCYTSLAQNIFNKVVHDRLERLVIAAAAFRARKFFDSNQNVLSSNLLGRLERMVRDSSNAENLANKVEQLREKAVWPLRTMLNGDQSLYDDFKDNQIWRWCRSLPGEQWRNLERFAVYIKIHEEDDLECSANISYKTYWQAFLRTLRQLYKKSTSDRRDENAVF